MVIVASGMVRGHVRLATTSHGGHSYSVGDLKPKRGFVFRALFVVCRGYTTYSQQSTVFAGVFAEETVWKTFLSALLIAFLEEKFSSYKFQAILEGHIKHKAEFYFSFVTELLSCFWRCFKTVIIN